MMLDPENPENPENPEDTEDTAEETLRQVLCGIYVLGRHIKVYFFETLFLNSLVWRYFLIRCPEGFIRKGEHNLELFNQLFWLLSMSFILCLLGMKPVSQILRGENFLKAELRKTFNIY
jgi:hypothetical protein